jgi:hypothetical protein
MRGASWIKYAAIFSSFLRRRVSRDFSHYYLTRENTRHATTSNKTSEQNINPNYYCSGKINAQLFQNKFPFLRKLSVSAMYNFQELYITA